MRYQLRYSSAARDTLRKIPREIALKFVAEFGDLADEQDPRLYVKRLRGAGEPPFYSLRIGQYRAIMSILDEVMVIHVIEVGHRSSGYRKF
ncbi:plasmid stabilization protein [Methanomicrobiaceae archaeon CYW5]|uniref:type II toxin-antitoxin system RelE family toxin n=1 Tax=Methanovulcanius yangii TaxID=1789227 RepID=UPI0029CA8C9A|nr:type II toxin-antitoxin system RelE/ParE family toxin [Methanovulcanius yangii]MBT8508265.1 plasmid stabilization protein [Methanovulcanius yangii]